LEGRKPFKRTWSSEEYSEINHLKERRDSLDSENHPEPHFRSVEWHSAKLESGASPRLG